jgi:PPOX class probable F420-dependent enzyme
MPDYGIVGPDEGCGLLPWTWAVERLTKSHDYWVATVWPDGRPHVAPVWGVWLDGAIWFSSGPTSRKTKNLTAQPRCTATTSNPAEPVVVNGTARRITERADIERYAAATAEKYKADYGSDFYAANALFEVVPASVFGLEEADFTGSPTRWTFPPA